MFKPSINSFILAFSPLSIRTFKLFDEDDLRDICEELRISLRLADINKSLEFKGSFIFVISTSTIFTTIW